MSNRNRRTADVLRLVKALSTLDGHQALDEIDRVVSRALDAGLYAESLRSWALDGQSLPGHVLDQEISRLDPDGADIDTEQLDRIYVSHYLRKLGNPSHDAISTVHNLLVVHYREQFYESPSFMGLGTLWSISLQWWAGDSEWMLGEELESARRKTDLELRSEACKWLGSQGAPDPFEGLSSIQ